MRGRQAGIAVIPREQAATVGANIRALRQGKGWTQAHVGELMGWVSNSTVCAAEGHRDGKQRGFTSDEVRRLAGIFGVKAWHPVHQLRRAPAARVLLPDLQGTDCPHGRGRPTVPVPGLAVRERAEVRAYQLGAWLPHVEPRAYGAN